MPLLCPWELFAETNSFAPLSHSSGAMLETFSKTHLPKLYLGKLSHSPSALRISPEYRVYAAISIHNSDFKLGQSPGNFLEASVWSSHVSSKSIHSSHLIFLLSHLGWGNLLCNHHMGFLQYSLWYKIYALSEPSSGSLEPTNPLLSH